MNSKILIFAFFAGTVFGGFHHGGSNMHFSPFFSLERNLTEDQRNQIKDVFKNPDLTKQQIEDNLRQLFNGFGLSAEFQEHVNKFEEKLNNITTLESEITANLSSGARALADAIVNTIRDKSITLQQQKTQIETHFNETSEEDRRALKEAVKSHLKDVFGGFGGGFGGHFGGHFGGPRGGMGGSWGSRGDWGRQGSWGPRGNDGSQGRWGRQGGWERRGHGRGGSNGTNTNTENAQA